MKKPILITKDLCKSFAIGGVQNHVLKNITMEIYEGDFTVIMGSSGSGKSTLLYNLSGMDKATSGKIQYGNTRLDKLSEDNLAKLRRKDFGFVFQQMHLVGNLNVFENICVPGYLVSKPKEVHKRAEELMKSTGISELSKRLPTQISGGQQQRGAIARSLINSPKILFADEPTGALNSKSGQEILNLLTKFNEDGQSILMVTHDIKAAIRANRLIYIKDGKVDGEMEMGNYTSENLESREKQVLSWLTVQGW